MGYGLRPVTAENENQFYEFMRANLAEIGALYDDFHEGYQQAVAFGEALLFYHDDKPVGASVMKITEGKSETYIEDVYIDSKERSRGHGRNLMSSCEGLAAHFGQKSIGLVCEAERLPFYRKLGYDEAGADGNNTTMKKALTP